MNIQHRRLLASTTRAAVLAALAMTTWGTAIQAADAQAKKGAIRTRNETPKFEDITLTTRDGVILRCTYYPGPESKQTVPLILVHDWDKSRGELHPVAQWLQQNLKLAVIAPDLRGHGNSVRAEGIDDPLDRTKFKKQAIDAMVWDIEACKTFLLKENNDGKLNIEQLGVMGTGLGACLALKWGVQDWSVRSLPTLKQGQDVKALILVSPVRSFKGLTINTELKALPILRNISTLVIVGREDSRSMSDAQRISKTFERAWGEQSKEAAKFLAAPTSLQSTDLVKARGTGVDSWIQTFIDRRLVQQADQFPWRDRTSPLK